MSRLRQVTGAVLAASILASTLMTGSTQDAPESEVSLRAEMASIALQRSSLPAGYVFTGETFLSAEQVASGNVTADALTEAGFVSQYLSVYTDPDTGFQISSYVSAWTDAEAATSGFDVIEDEAGAHPDGSFTDGEAGVGEAPGETTTGTYPDPADSGITVSSVDTTFRMDRFLVGTSLQTFDGSAPDAAVVSELAGAIEARATAAVAGESPEGTDLALAPQALPLFAIGPSLQTGFLGAQDVEQMYGLQGSALGTLTAAWTDAVGLGDSDSGPYVSVALTQFATPEDAEAVVGQFADLTPATNGTEQVEGFALDGATAAAFTYPSAASGGETPDSFRIAAIKESTLIVIDVQGAPTIEVAETAAIDLAGNQLGCIGQSSCAVPELPTELAGN
jgi:hypothetical protein